MKDDKHSIELGKKIALARKNKSLSLSSLAKKINVTSSLLSQIERGLANPSLNTLRMIAVTLEIPLFSLFAEQTSIDSLVTRAARRKKIIFPQSNWEYNLLSPDLNGAIEMVLMRIPPNTESSETPLSHVGEEIAYVLSGSVVLSLGDIVEALGEGDSVKIPPKTEHKWENRGDIDANVIFAITPPGF